MEQKNMEILFTIIAVVFVIGIVGGAAYWMSNSGNSTATADNNQSGENGQANHGTTNLFATNDPSGTGSTADLRGKITINGGKPDLQIKTLTDGTAYSGYIRFTYPMEQRYSSITRGTESTGGLIDPDGNYNVGDIYENVPFSIMVTLYKNNTGGQITSQISDDRGSPLQMTINGNETRDFDLKM
ncbi:MAG TPA: hypothetical protein VK436_04630 [Methanocella sp.]|nr:hypothetical protein [Methanocella sp.]